MIDNLKDLELKYPTRLSHNELKQNIKQIYEKYIRRKEEAILDSVAIAAGLSIEMLQERINPQILEAFRLQYPNLDMENLSSYSSEELQGIVNGIKGKYFEILIRDKLNSGDWIGDLHLEEGQQAILAESATQPGWDLKIVDADGNIIDHLQAKATDSIAYIKEALEKYDYPIIATDEAAEKLVDQIDEKIIDSNISDAAVENVTEETVGEMSESFLEDFFDHFNPLIPLAIIAITESSKVITGKYTLQKAIARSKNRTLKSMVSLGVGSIFAALDFGTISIPSSILTRFAIDRQENICFSSKLLKLHTIWLKKVISESNNEKTYFTLANSG